MKANKLKILNLIISISSILFVLIVWTISFYAVNNEYAVPSPQKAIVEFFMLFTKTHFWKSFFWTVSRTLLSFIISLVLAFCCAVLCIAVKGFSFFVKPIVAIVRTLPTVAVILLILFLTQTDRTLTPVYVTVLVLFPLLSSIISAALAEVDVGVLQMARIYGLTKRQIVTKIYFPTATPSIVSQMGQTLSFAVKITVSAEIMCGTYTSIGGMTSIASSNVQMSLLVALTIFAVLIGLFFECIFYLFGRYVRRAFHCA